MNEKSEEEGKYRAKRRVFRFSFSSDDDDDDSFSSFSLFGKYR